MYIDLCIRIYKNIYIHFTRIRLMNGNCCVVIVIKVKEIDIWTNKVEVSIWTKSADILQAFWNSVCVAHGRFASIWLLIYEVEIILELLVSIGWGDIINGKDKEFILKYFVFFLINSFVFLFFLKKNKRIDIF